MLYFWTVIYYKDNARIIEHFDNARQAYNFVKSCPFSCIVLNNDTTAND